MNKIFYGCASLTGTVTIHANPSTYGECFAGTVKVIVLKGDVSKTKLANIAATANNGNVTY